MFLLISFVVILTMVRSNYVSHPYILLLAASTAMLLMGLNTIAQQLPQNFTGKWRGEFIIRDGITSPFNFEIKDDGKVYLLNAEESFETGNIRVEKDSLFISLDQFDNELAFRIHENTLKGVLRKQDHTGPNISAKAEKGKTYRFKEKNIHADKDISGKYDVVFKLEDGREDKAVGIFKQEGKKLTGTFLKNSGDTRFLEGIVEANRFYLSSFIGSSPGYYHGTFTKDGKISGEQVGTRIRNSFSGIYNENAALPDPFLNVNKANSTLDFSLPDINGKTISLKDEKYRNKVVVIAITGTWCPNCIDEAAFLSPWYKENKDRGVEVITLHYERSTDSAFVNKVMERFRKRFDIEYDQAFGGIAQNDTVLKTLRGLESFRAFPTTIFVGKNGNVDLIHSGYSGPATGKYYDDFKKEFNEEVDKLLKK